MSNAASVIVTTGGILLGLLLAAAFSRSEFGNYEMSELYLLLSALAGLAFFGSLGGYVLGHRRNLDLAYTSALGALVGAIGIGLGAPLLFLAVGWALKLLGLI
jgi:hypothetical protein